MRIKIEILLAFFELFLPFVIGERWPSAEEFALRIQTKLGEKSGEKPKLLQGDEFHVDFYAKNGLSKAEDDGIVVIKYQLPDGKHVAEVYDWTNVSLFGIFRFYSIRLWVCRVSFEDFSKFMGKSVRF